MNTALAITAFALAVWGWIVIDKWWLTRQLEEAFRGRVSLSDGDFYAKYYSTSGIGFSVIVGVRQVLADELNIDASRIVPSDSFSNKLAFLLRRDDMVDVSIVETLEKRFRISIPDAQAAQAKTVHDVISLVHTKVIAAAP
jgi:acyl carrier protein